MGAKATSNYLLVGFGKKFDDEISLPDGSTILVDTSYHETRHLRIWGEVLAVPEQLTDAVTIDMPYVGYPVPKRYIGHDFISSMTSWGNRMWSKADYSAAGYIPVLETLADWKQECLPGDKIYIDYTAIMPENEVEPGVYKIRYDNVLAVVRDGEIIPIGGYCLLEPSMQTEEEFTKEISGIKIWLQADAKPRYLRGILHHGPAELRGKEVYYVPNADWANVIEGKLYYAVREKDIFGYNELTTDMKTKFKPLGDRVIVKQMPAAERTAMGILIPLSAQHKPGYGTVLEVGPKVSELEEGELVLFAAGAGFEADINGGMALIMREADIMCKG